MNRDDPPEWLKTGCGCLVVLIHFAAMIGIILIIAHFVFKYW